MHDGDRDKRDLDEAQGAAGVDDADATLLVPEHQALVETRVAASGGSDAEGPEDDESTRIGGDPAEASDPDATVYGEGDGLSVEERTVLTAGTVLFGEYEIVDLLGAGGMGEVYRARHRRLDETRAIKVMHQAVAKDPAAGEFFDREAKALLSVRHPAVVHCHDLLSDEHDRVYLVMEMIDGISLSDRIRNEPLSAEELRTLGARIASGLAAAHGCGVVHRDLSPDNIVLPGGRLEEAKLIDFGIAKVLASGQETIMDGFKGKLPYASPEQLGFFDGHIDGRSDMYSFGLVLYAAATGHILDMGMTFVDAVDSRRDFSGLPADFPAALRDEVEPLLALDPDDRPSTLAGFFGGELRLAQAAAGVVETPTGGLPGWALPAGGAALAAVVALGIFLAVRDPEPEPVEVAAIPAPAAEQVEPTPEPPPPKVVEVEKPTPVATRTKPKPAGPGAKARLKIHGLLRGAAVAYERDWLTSPPGENAYEKYREVLSLDSRNKEARAGIQRIGDRYIALGREALDDGDAAAARKYLDGARKVTPKHAKLAELQAAVERASS